jgi:hypothetical protein
VSRRPRCMPSARRSGNGRERKTRSPPSRSRSQTAPTARYVAPATPSHPLSTTAPPNVTPRRLPRRDPSGSDDLHDANEQATLHSGRAAHPTSINERPPLRANSARRRRPHRQPHARRLCRGDSRFGGGDRRPQSVGRKRDPQRFGRRRGPQCAEASVFDVWQPSRCRSVRWTIGGRTVVASLSGVERCAHQRREAGVCESETRHLLLV